MSKMSFTGGRSDLGSSSDAGMSFRNTRNQPGLISKSKQKDSGLSPTDKMQSILIQKLQEITKSQKILFTGFSKKPTTASKLVFSQS